jgi:hypothetical protein
MFMNTCNISITHRRIPCPMCGSYVTRTVYPICMYKPVCLCVCMEWFIFHVWQARDKGLLPSFTKDHVPSTEFASTSAAAGIGAASPRQQAEASTEGRSAQIQSPDLRTLPTVSQASTSTYSTQPKDSESDNTAHNSVGKARSSTDAAPGSSQQSPSRIVPQDPYSPSKSAQTSEPAGTQQSADKDKNAHAPSIQLRATSSQSIQAPPETTDEHVVTSKNPTQTQNVVQTEPTQSVPATTGGISMKMQPASQATMSQTDEESSEVDGPVGCVLNFKVHITTTTDMSSHTYE